MVAAHSQAVSLRSRMINALGWLLGGTVLSQVLRLVSNLILTRLLVPEAFGLMAAVSTLYFAIAMFSDLGVWQSIIKSPRGADPDFLGTAWSIQILRGLIISLFVLLLALGVEFAATNEWFADGTVYADDRLPTMIAVYALLALIQGLESMQVSLARREVQTRLLFRWETTAQIFTITVIILLAWATRSVWALLFGVLIGDAVKVLLSHLLFPGYRARLGWDKDCAKEILGFGKWILLTSTMGILATQGEKLVLGAYLGLTAFGIYTIAANLLSAVIAVYGSVNGRLLFPALSIVQRDKDRGNVIRMYEKLQKIVDIILGCASGVLLLVGHWVVSFLYDQRYQDAGWMLAALAIGLLGLRYQMLEQLMFTMGKPNWVAANNAVRAASIFIFVPLGFAFGAEGGAIWAIAFCQFASWPLCMYFKYRHRLLNLRSEIWWGPALLAGMALGYCLDYIIRTMS